MNKYNNLPFQIGDVIELDGKERTVYSISLTPSFNYDGWVQFGPESYYMWNCIEYVLEHGKVLKHQDTELWKKLQGNNDGYIKINWKFFSGMCGIAALYSLYLESVIAYLLLAVACLTTFAFSIMEEFK